MTVDLNDLIPSLQREVSPPGTDLYPGAVDDDWLGQLEDSFWEAKLFGFFATYTESDGLVQPIATGDPDLGRDLQQLIVLFAGIRSVRMKMTSINTQFKAVAGPVSFETANSAGILKEVLQELQAKIATLVSYLGGLVGTQTYYINGLMARSDSLHYGDEVWTGSVDNRGNSSWHGWW